MCDPDDEPEIAWAVRMEYLYILRLQGLFTALRAFSRAANRHPVPGGPGREDRRRCLAERRREVRMAQQDVASARWLIRWAVAEETARLERAVEWLTLRAHLETWRA